MRRSLKRQHRLCGKYGCVLKDHPDPEGSGAAYVCIHCGSVMSMNRFASRESSNLPWIRRARLL
jgi:hypothetical protein